MNMDITTSLDSSNTTVSSKKLAFSSAERELIAALVRDRPIIEDKRTNAKNIQLKKQAWKDLAVAYNSQPYVSKRLSHQLKRCWENIKSNRKRELSQESISLKRTGGGPPESGSAVSSNNVIDTICPFLNFKVPGVIDSNSIEILDDTKIPSYGKNPESEDVSPTVKVTDFSILDQKKENSYKRPANLENIMDENVCSEPKRKYNKEIFYTPTTSSKKFLSETEARIKRTKINIQQDQALHELRIQREKILIERESNQLDYEKQIHELQIQKMKLEIELLKNKKGN